jgi:hypothetical protein
LILRASSIDAPKGELAANAFVFDMNKVFEDFVTIALRESMERYGGEIRSQWQGHLDSEKRIRIIPDLIWWIGGQCMDVAETKYKACAHATLPNAARISDLAYCAARKHPGLPDLCERTAGQRLVHRSSMRQRSVRTLDVRRIRSSLAQVEVLAAKSA